jgi:hypothetical protein
MQVRVISNEHGIQLSRVADDGTAIEETIHINRELFKTLAALQSNSDHQVVFSESFSGPTHRHVGNGSANINYWIKNNLVVTEKS